MDSTTTKIYQLDIPQASVELTEDLDFVLKLDAEEAMDLYWQLKGLLIYGEGK